MKTIHAFTLGIGILAVALTPILASAASDSKTVTLNATVSARAKLTISPTTIHFPDADPDVLNPIPANENSVSVQANIRTGAAGVATAPGIASIRAQAIVNLRNGILKVGFGLVLISEPAMSTRWR